MDSYYHGILAATELSNWWKSLNLMDTARSINLNLCMVPFFTNWQCKKTILGSDSLALWKHRNWDFLIDQKLGNNLTWLPNTPMAQADETWLDGNHVAASWAGSPKMKIWETATMVCPVNMRGYISLPVAATLTQLPRQVPRVPNSTDSRRPCKKISVCKWISTLLVDWLVDFH